ncbi:MAG: hypothetical protein M3X11_13010 [Acidobacteriota bacterium]|nr:hypothetical protein [Acidobacteriota bacterium]
MDVTNRELSTVLAKLSLGETITLADENGAPVALLVSLQSATKNAQDQAEGVSSDSVKDVMNASTGPDPGKKNETFAAVVGQREGESDDWIEQMKALAARVSAAWQGDKSGLEELSEMRR